MIATYVESVTAAMDALLDLALKFAMPAAVCAGVLLLAMILIAGFGRDIGWIQKIDCKSGAGAVCGYAGLGILVVGAWTVLKGIQPLAEEDIRWRERVEATTNPVPDAPPVVQYGPSAAVLSEHTYSRTLTMPPAFLQRVGTEGVGVLAPYLTDPSAEGVLALVDTFRQSGKDVVFTREVTRMNEDPIPFSTSNLHLRVKRLPGRAYDADFDGEYVFQNPRTEPITVRFLFPMPAQNTVRDLSVRVEGQAIAEPNNSGVYEWKNIVGPGERRTAVVHYRVIGARTWSYDLGSQRRRVQQFRLDADTEGTVRFLRGSLKPTSGSRDKLRWDLTNVVTAQQVAIALPAEMESQEAYLQALSALPVSFILCLIGMVAIGIWRNAKLTPGKLGVAMTVFGFGLGAGVILSNYFGPGIAMVVGPIIGGILSVRWLGRPFLAVAVPVSLIPAAFLSPHHSGLIVLCTTLAAYSLISGPGRRWKLAWDRY